MRSVYCHSQINTFLTFSYIDNKNSNIKYEFPNRSQINYGRFWEQFDQYVPATSRRLVDKGNSALNLNKASRLIKSIHKNDLNLVQLKNTLRRNYLYVIEGQNWTLIFNLRKYMRYLCKHAGSLRYSRWVWQSEMYKKARSIPFSN